MKRAKTCHNCPYNGMNGEGRVFNPEAAAACLECAKCKDIPLSHGGVCFVSNDTGAVAGSWADEVAFNTWAEKWREELSGAGKLTTDADLDHSFLRLALVELSQMAKDEIRVIYGISHGRTFAEIAEVGGADIQFVRRTLHLVLTKFPHVRAVLAFGRRLGLGCPKGLGDKKKTNKYWLFDKKERPQWQTYETLSRSRRVKREQ